jgi:hypothetical protein
MVVVHRQSIRRTNRYNCQHFFAFSLAKHGFLLLYHQKKDSSAQKIS